MITEKNNLKDIVFINYWKFSQNFTSAIKILSKEVFVIHVWLSLRYPLTFIYGNVINKAKKFKSDTSKLINSLKNIIRQSYDLATIVRPSKRNVGSRTRLLWGPENRLRLLSKLRIMVNLPRFTSYVIKEVSLELVK